MTEEHRKNVNKLQQELETEKNELQKELDQMVCVTFISCNYLSRLKQYFVPLCETAGKRHFKTYLHGP